MKKTMLLLAGLGFILVGCATSGKANNSQKAIQTAYLIDSLIAEANFQFVPTDVTYPTGPLVRIRKYESAKFLPGRVYVHMTGTNFEGQYEGPTPYDRADKEGDKWYVNSTFDYFTGKITFEFTINRSTGAAVLKVDNNRMGRWFTYNGFIQPN